MEQWTSTGLDNNNGYTLSLLLPGIRTLLNDESWDKNLEENDKERIFECLGILRSLLNEKRNNKNIWEMGGVCIKEYPPNSFVTYWALETLKVFNQFEELNFRITYNWALFTFYKEISNFNSKALEKFDVFQLAYSLLILKKFFKHTLPKSIVKHALYIIFKVQNEIGRWDLGHPLFNYPGAGNAYCHDFEMFRSLLKDLKEDYFDLLIEFLPSLYKSLTWIVNNYQEVNSKGICGWNSGHYYPWPYPESWATAAVLDFLFEYKQILQQNAQNNILREFRYFDENLAKVKNFDEMLDSVVKVGSNYKYLIKDILKENFKETFDKEKLAKGIILCGPPGTGKTTLAGSIAKTINWKFIEISPGLFIEKNLWSVGEKTREIFECIEILDKVVVLFDELDELVRKRGSSTELLGRFMTTTILPYFQKLAQQKKIIYILATNHIREFDIAIQRPGRFQLIINVNQPARSELIEKYKEILSENGCSDAIIENLFNFLEWEMFQEIIEDIFTQDDLDGIDFHFDESIQNNLVEEFKERIKTLKSEKINLFEEALEKKRKRDGYINFKTDDEINEYHKRIDKVNEIFNRFTYPEIEPFIKNYLLETLKTVNIDYEEVKKSFFMINNELILTKVYKDSIEKFKKDPGLKEECQYWLADNRIS